MNYFEFADSIRCENRFVFGGACLDFLNVLAVSARGRLIETSDDSFLYRAQINSPDDIKEVTPDCDPVPITLSEKRMMPDPRYVGDNRLSPKGIAYLYMADSPQTAIAEMRPYKGACVTVATMRVRKRAQVIDLLPRKGEDNIWRDVDFSMSIPTTPDDSWRSYLPTQCIAEFLKINGFAGIKYRSSMRNEGYNIALFDVSNAKIIARHLYHIQQISYMPVKEMDRRREV